MNRTKLKAYAPKARREFIQAVTDRAAYHGLTKNNIEPIIEKGDVAIIAGKAFPRTIAAKRNRLEERIGQQGFDQVMEAMAYTWFNRFVAIRFMELHGYLDHGYRVLSHPEGKATPEIVEHAEHVDLPGLDREKVIELKIEGTREAELYGMLLTAQCNALNESMPFLFEKIDDETELLLPENLLHSDSPIRKLANEIPEEEWEDIEIIGWLYQFYIAEKKDQVIGKVVKSEDIPAATQLFTPNWIVKYMVQNTLGRQWLATYPDSQLKGKMEYYIEPAEQTTEVQEQLKAITPKSLNPEELTFLDPATGSGHILVEAYDLFKAIYQERGYRAKDIPRLILEKNLFGLEIDDRAAQLAAFALIMKARGDDRRIFDGSVQPHVLAIQESKGMNAQKITEALNAPILKTKLPSREFLFEEIEEARTPLFTRSSMSIKGEISEDGIAELIALFENGKTFGSLIRIPEELAKKLPEIADRVKDALEYGDMHGQAAAKSIRPFVEQFMILSCKYNFVITNPPYMNQSYFDTKLKKFVDKEYANGKSDLYGCFMVKNLNFSKMHGFIGMITIPNWMFLSSFENLRNFLLENCSVESLIHNGRGVWGSDFGSCSFVIRNFCLQTYKATYKRLFSKQGSVASLEDLEKRFFEYPVYDAIIKDFINIPGTPIAYWMSSGIKKIFQEMPKLEKYVFSEGPCKTGNDEKYLRTFWEVDENKIRSQHWCFCSKGGAVRKYYGNIEHVILWTNEARNHYKVDKISRITSEKVWNKKGITWTIVTAVAASSFRELPKGCKFNSVSPTIFLKEYNDIEYLKIIAFLNSKIAEIILSFLNPTLAMNVGNVISLPFDPLKINLNKSDIEEMIDIYRTDWNSFETSWGFQSLSLLTKPVKALSIAESWQNWEAHCIGQNKRMQELETKNNRSLIKAYGLEEELTPEVPEDLITLVSSNQALDMKRLISYAIGCIMGRYSLDQPGLVYAHSGNNDFDQSKYKSFSANDDGMIPVMDMDWFPDDATNCIEEFLKVAWASETLEVNIKFIADSLGTNRGESPMETIRRYLITVFYKNHLSIYKNRPIYWLFSSGKLRAFQCLVYLHRYHEGTLPRMRTDYVIPLQGKISARIDQLAEDINAATSTSHRKKLEKEKDKLVKQLAELRTFDEKLRHYADLRISLDLDDGVKVNYGKFGDLLAEAKAVTGTSED